MWRAHGSDRGQVLIFFVFAIIGLVGITGLAIDGGNIYADRRQAQNAADTAALAGAVTSINMQHGGAAASDCHNLTGSGTCGLAVLSAAQQRAADNGYYFGNLQANTVAVKIPPVEGPYAGDTDYIQVIIDTNVNTWFARVLGISQLHNHVQGTALAKYVAEHSLYGGSAMAALAPTGCSTFDISGSAQLTLNNGANIFVNSNSTSCAGFNVQHCGELTISPPQPVGVVGSASAPTCTAPDQTTTAVTAPAVKFPPDPIFATPAECSAAYASLDGTWNAGDSTWHFQPGHYSSLPPEKNTTLEPGVYCIDNLIKTVANNSTLIGHRVFLWIRAGGYYSFESGTIVLDPPTSGQYAGYLIYVDANSSMTPGGLTCTINGNNTSSYTGAIYAPYCHIKLNGTSGIGGWKAQIIGYDFIVNGTTGIVLDHNGTPSATVPELQWTGLYH